MKQGALRKEAFEELEAYLLGTMEAAQRNRFEQKLAMDPELRQELELERENILAVEMAGVERTLRSLRAEQGGSSMSASRWAPWLKYAAAAALLLGGLAWWLARPPLEQRMFAQYYQPDPGLPVPMSVTNDPEFQDAMVAYKLEEYPEAVAKWNALLGADPGNDTLRYYIASAQLAQGRPAEAIPLFRQVIADTTSAFHGKARWFLYLAYLQMGDEAALRAMEMIKDPVYGERAREIERQIHR
jgi:tetratricopeptide (TPR) repeat protein